MGKRKEPDPEPDFMNGMRKVTIYQKTQPKTSLMTHQEADVLDREKFDLYMDNVRMKIVVRKKNGRIHTITGSVEGIGPRAMSFARKSMRYPGIFLLPYEIGSLNPQYDSHYIDDCITQYVARLRKNLFRESGEEPWFLLNGGSRQYAFNADRSYCIIERADSKPNNA